MILFSVCADDETMAAFADWSAEDMDMLAELIDGRSSFAPPFPVVPAIP